MDLTISQMKHFIASEDGPTAVEYAVVVALIVIAAMGAITAFEDALSGWFSSMGTTIENMPK